MNRINEKSKIIHSTDCRYAKCSGISVAGKKNLIFKGYRPCVYCGTEENWSSADLYDYVPGTNEEYLLITVDRRLNNETEYTTIKKKPEFKLDKETGKYVAEVPFEEEADYIFDIKYTDRSGNVFDSYEAEKFTIDKTAPVLELEYKSDEPINDIYYKPDRTAMITVTEHNFNASDVEFTVEAVDVNGDPVDISQKGYEAYLQNMQNWNQNGDEYTAILPVFDIEAMYTITMTYTDLAGNEQVEVVKDRFCVDKTVPQNLEITYAEPVSWKQFLEDIFWFYKAPVTVTLSAEDMTSGIDYFEYSYKVEDGELVDSNNYVASEGSTVIEFKADYLKTLDVGEHTVTVVFKDGIATTKFEVKNLDFSVQVPSRNEIRNKDGIILHTNIEEVAPDGSYVVWTSNNNNFKEYNDDNMLKIIAHNKGYTTFTATLYDKYGNELASDTVEMYSKSGFFDKIGGFFRSIFGMIKIYEN